MFSPATQAATSIHLQRWQCARLNRALLHAELSDIPVRNPFKNVHSAPADTGKSAALRLRNPPKEPIQDTAVLRSCGVTNTPCLGLSVKKLDISRGTCPGDSLKVNLCKPTHRSQCHSLLQDIG